MFHFDFWKRNKDLIEEIEATNEFIWHYLLVNSHLEVNKFWDLNLDLNVYILHQDG